MNNKGDFDTMDETNNKAACWFCTLLGKLTIIVTYLVIFAFFLYSPLILKLFQTDNTLNVCAFTETFSPQAIALFEKETGVKVNVTYIESDEQVYAKFTINHGDGYDVVNISDYMVHMLAEGNYLAPIDREKISSKAYIYPHFSNLPCDPKNQYSIAHKWYIYGLVYDKQFFNCTPDTMSLDYVFKNPSTLAEQGLVTSPYKTCMIDDARDAVLFAAIYLYGGFRMFTEQEFKRITQLLVNQKSWIEAYTSKSVQYFLFTNLVPVALTSSDYIRKLWKSSDRFGFAIPREGSMVIVESMVIPKPCKKLELAHKFINFMLSTKIATINSTTYGYGSANQQANEHFGPTMLSNPHLFPDPETFKRLHMLLLPQSLRNRINQIWLEVGFA
jgi:spermidine/putrescine transport system substrate-binding protein